MIDAVTPPLGLAHLHAADLVGWTAARGGKLPAVSKSAILNKLAALGYAVTLTKSAA